MDKWRLFRFLLLYMRYFSERGKVTTSLGLLVFISEERFNIFCFLKKTEKYSFLDQLLYPTTFFSALTRYANTCTVSKYVKKQRMQHTT